MKNYLEQFKTKEETEKEIARINKEIKGEKSNQVDLELAKKKIALINHIDYLRQKRLLDAYARLESKRG